MIVFGAMEAALTPLMESIESGFPGIKVFSLPSVDHPEWGRHIELGVKGERANARRGLPLASLDGLKTAGRQAGPRIGAMRLRNAPYAVHPTHRRGANARDVTGMLSAKFLMRGFGAGELRRPRSKPPPSTARTNLREIY